MFGQVGKDDFYVLFSVLELHDDIQQLSAEQVRGFSGWRPGAGSLRIPAALHQGGGRHRHYRDCRTSQTVFFYVENYFLHTVTNRCSSPHIFLG
jgi:hypothetical protein